MTKSRKKVMSASGSRAVLNRLYRGVDFKERLRHDPIEFPHRYSRPEDIEIAGFIATSFAYGKVGLFKPVIESILKPGGKHPSSFIKNFSLRRDKKYLKDISYRFSKNEDILCFINMLGVALREWGMLKNLFYHHSNQEHKDVKDALSGFAGYFLEMEMSGIYGDNLRTQGVTHLIPSPKKGSACKRLNLFLRWMVRRKDIDLGIWDEIPPSKLIIPLDTHIARISRCLGLTRRASSDWRTAKEITESLKKFDPHDPIKYDFALCHHGISGHCKGEKHKDICLSCSL